MKRRTFLAAALSGAAVPARARARPPASILLYSGWQTVNIGDVGHTPGTLRFLERYLPRVRARLWLRSTNQEVTAMLRRRFPRVPIVEGTLDATGKASTPALQAAFDDARLFIQNSGMHWNRFWPPPVGLLRACLARGKAFGLYGQSFDGLPTGREAEARELLSRAAFIYCRDNESLATLRRAEVRPSILEFGPDGCFGIDVRDDRRALAFLRRHGLEPGRFITVTLRSNTPKKRAEAGAPAAGNVLNPPEPTAADRAQDDLWAEKLRTVIAAAIRKLGLRVLLAPEVDKEIEPARRLLLDRLDPDLRPGVVHRETFWNADEAASVYARAHTVVAMEPHSCIIALANGTPVLHVPSLKHGVKAWMFRDLGLPEWLHDIDADPAERFVEALDHIHRHPVHARAKVARAMAFVERRSAEMMADIGRLAAAG